MLLFKCCTYFPPTRLLDILDYYSTNAIINQTTLYTGKAFAVQLEDVNTTNGCFTKKNFIVNLGSFDTAIAGNATLVISPFRTENTTASVLLVPQCVDDYTQNSMTLMYRLTFYTFLRDTLFQSPKQKNEGFELGSIIISVGGTGVSLAKTLQLSFQVLKVKIQC